MGAGGQKEEITPKGGDQCFLWKPSRWWFFSHLKFLAFLNWASFLLRIQLKIVLVIYTKTVFLLHAIIRLFLLFPSWFLNLVLVPLVSHDLPFFPATTLLTSGFSSHCQVKFFSQWRFRENCDAQSVESASWYLGSKRKRVQGCEGGRCSVQLTFWHFRGKKGERKKLELRSSDKDEGNTSIISLHY